MAIIDSHVHTQFSWDTVEGDMAASCEAALAAGLDGVAFTDHADVDAWDVATSDEQPLGEPLASLVVDGVVAPPPLDRDAYLAAIDGCRRRYPSLAILTGAELGEAHRHPARSAAQAGGLERILGSVHSVELDGTFLEPPGLVQRLGAAGAVHAMLDETERMIAGTDLPHVLTHPDYVFRYLAPGDAPITAFEERYRHVLGLAADAGLAMELNTARLSTELVGWWRDAGGRTVSIGSDSHSPATLGRGFAGAVALLAAHGYREPVDPRGFFALP